MKQVKLIALLVMLCCPAYATDRFVSMNGNDLNPCTSASPCKTPAKVMSVRLPGDRLVFYAGVYDFGAVESVPIVPFGDGPVTINGHIVDANFALWTPLPATTIPDMAVRFKPGGKLKTVKWTRRVGDTSTQAICTINKSTTVDVQ